MEDSGIDSGDHTGDKRLDIGDRLFLGVSDSSSSADSSRSPTRNNSTVSTTAVVIAAHVSSPPAQSAATTITTTATTNIMPTSRQLQRKLEARIEHARRLHQEYRTVGGGSGGGGGGGAGAVSGLISAAPGLIPIRRLPIPGAKDHQPLVQWDTDDSEEDIINFFPLSRKESKVHHELTDTFSIEEMSISGDEEDEEDLHLVPPQTVYRTITCCPVSSCVIL